MGAITKHTKETVGIADRNNQGKLELLDGNQTMVLMTRYLLEKKKEKGLKGNEFIATTIVSTPMMDALAKAKASGLYMICTMSKHAAEAKGWSHGDTLLLLRAQVATIREGGGPAARAAAARVARRSSTAARRRQRRME